jgi:CBS domain-containing protein
MQLADLLTSDRIVVPLRARTLAEALGVLLERLGLTGMESAAGARDDEPFLARPAELAAGSAVEVFRVGDDVLVMAVQSSEVDDLAVALAVSIDPFETEWIGEEPGTARALLLLVTPRRLSTLKVQVIPTLTRTLRNRDRAERLLSARSPSEVRAFEELMEVELHEKLLVENALTPLTYRIYPDTPVTEVVELMVEKGLATLPVVGEKFEVLGIITSADALKHLLARRMTGDGEADSTGGNRPLQARDVMSRSILCVSENQSLMEAANIMVNRDVAQLPVVREGELIGFLTRDTVLRKIFGS